jgi:photosystem II stability/assembly factor-like uncharacterized protein
VTEENTWQQAIQPPVSNLAALSRVNTGVAYAVGCGPTVPIGSQPGDLLRTEDGGRTWQILPLPQGCAGGASDLVALSTDDLWLVQFGQPATDLTSKWVYRSSDGGASWTLMASVDFEHPNQGTGHISAMGDFGPLSALDAETDRAWLAEDRGGLLVTDDGGLSWRDAFDNANAGAFGPPFVSFLDATHGWASTGGGLWRTTNGETWTEIAQPVG